MWTHIRTAPNKVVAETWCELLEEQGIPTRVERDEAEAHLEDLARQRIFVPKDRVEVAEEILRAM
jgi:hypothetical protein